MELLKKLSTPKSLLQWSLRFLLSAIGNSDTDLLFSYILLQMKVTSIHNITICLEFTITDPWVGCREEKTHSFPFIFSSISISSLCDPLVYCSSLVAIRSVAQLYLLPNIFCRENGRLEMLLLILYGCWTRREIREVLNLMIFMFWGCGRSRGKWWVRHIKVGVWIWWREDGEGLCWTWDRRVRCMMGPVCVLWLSGSDKSYY